MFDKLKSIFVVTDEEFKKQAGGGKEAPQKTESSPPISPSPSASTIPNVTPNNSPIPSQGKVSDKFLNILMGAMDKNNIDGFDYLEYKQSLKSLSKMSMDEATQYQSAFAMAQTMGATPQKLVDTAQHYLNILKTEEQKFQQALVNQKAKQIGSKEQRIKDLGAIVKQKEEQIKKLQTEMEAHKQEAVKLKSQISNASVKVENTGNNFAVTYNVVVSQIQKDIENMKTYLK